MGVKTKMFYIYFGNNVFLKRLKTLQKINVFIIEIIIIIIKLHSYIIFKVKSSNRLLHFKFNLPQYRGKMSCSWGKVGNG